jgi:hypothetical protein
MVQRVGDPDAHCDLEAGGDLLPGVISDGVADALAEHHGVFDRRLGHDDEELLAAIA